MSRAARTLVLAGLCALSAPLSAMGARPAPLDAYLSKAGELWRAGDLSSTAAVLEPLAWGDPKAARDWAAFLFLQQRYADLDAFFKVSASAALKDDEARLWLARAQLDLGRRQEALGTLKALSESAKPLPMALAAEAGQLWPGTWPDALSAVAGTRWDASSSLVAAEAAAAAGKDLDAELLYKRAEKADPSYSHVHARLAALYAKDGRLKEQRIRLERALGVDPDDEATRKALNQLMAAHSSLRQQLEKEEHKVLQAFLQRPNPTVTPLPILPGEPLVRVGVIAEAPRFRLKLGGAYLVEGEGRTLPAHSIWEARLAKGGGWELAPLSPSTETALKFGGPTRLLPLDAASTFGLYDVASGAGYFWAGKEDRYYRGLCELRPRKAEGLSLINELGMEAYLLSVLPSEMPPHWPAAALEAQAVAARTDAWRSLGRFKSKGYDLCPTVACAVYSGVGAEDKRSSAAITRTAGEVLEAPNGRLHATYYMHHSGGHTQEPGEAWSDTGTSSPPMSVFDGPSSSSSAKLFPLGPAALLHYLDDLDLDVKVWARSSSSFRWTLRFNAAELDARAGRRHKVGPIQSVIPSERTGSGFVRKAIFRGDEGDSEGSSDYLRSALKGIRSNLFYSEARYGADGRLEALLLHGGGWGHGVGMAQAGARAQAEAGRDAHDILRSYFPSGRLKRRYPEP